jgi:hypothetical protein
MMFMMGAILALPPTSMAQPGRPQPPDSVRLYMFDCGQLNIADISVYQLKREEIATNLMSVPCFLIAHPRGNLMWDVGAVPDSAFRPGNASATLRSATSTKTLQAR